MMGLNAPFGARCFLTCEAKVRDLSSRVRLNAPFGARCFLTDCGDCCAREDQGLNAPFGARCFLTELYWFFYTSDANAS